LRSNGTRGGAPEFRAALAEDIGAMAEIDRQSSPRPVSASHYETYCGTGPESHRRALVCELDGEVVGFLASSRVLDEGTVINLVVRGDCRRLGIGGRLLRLSLAEMRRAGLNRCLLEVRASNTAAQRLYEGEGFRLDGSRPGYYTTDCGEREDALLMSLQL